MLFNSYDYLLYFLPLALALYFALGRSSATWAVAWLVAASLFFYAWWDPRYLPLILASIGVNFLFGRALHRQSRHAKALLACGVGANLLLLGCVQVRGLRAVECRRAAGHAAPAAASRAAAGHQLLHLHADRLSGGRRKAQGARVQSRQLCALRDLLPAPARGPDPPSQGDDAAVRRRPAQALRLATNLAAGWPLRPRPRARRCWSPTRSRRCANAGFAARAGARRSPTAGSRCSPTRCSSTSTSAATPTWRSARR